MAAGAVLRFAGLDTQSFWLDEAFTRVLLDQGFGAMLDHLPDSESTPPLYYALAWVWSRVFGLGEAGLRSLSALLGTATIAVAYLIGRELAARAGGLVLAVLVAASPFLVWYSQEARAYVLVILLGAATLLFALRAAREPGRTWLAAWAVAAAAALATHYFALFPVLAEAAWLYRVGLRRPLALAALLPATAAAALTPLALAQRDAGGAAGVGDAPLGDRVVDVAKEFVVGVYGGPVGGLGPLCALLAVAGVALAALRSDRVARPALVAALAVGASTLLLPLLAALAGADYFSPRYVAVAWIPLFAVAAVGFAASRVGLALAGLLAAAFLVVTVAVPLTPRLQRDDWRGAAESLGEPSGARAIVISPDVGFVPLSVYEPGLAAPPGPRFAVRELDLVVMIRDGREPPRASPLPGFRPAGASRTATFVSARFISDVPRDVDAEALRRIRSTPDRSGLVYQRP